MNYTKKEWKIVGNSIYDGKDKSNPEIICYLQGENRKVNAHLIAAAPEMYEALKQLVVDYETLCSRKPKNTLLLTRLSLAKQALAKAEGK